MSKYPWPESNHALAFGFTFPFYAGFPRRSGFSFWTVDLVSGKVVLVMIVMGIFGNYYVCKVSVCDPLCCKIMCCASRFWTGGREAGGSRSKILPEGPWKRMLGLVYTLRLLDEAGEVGRDQHPGPENPAQSAHDWSTQGVFPWKSFPPRFLCVLNWRAAFCACLSKIFVLQELCSSLPPSCPETSGIESHSKQGNKVAWQQIRQVGHMYFWNCAPAETIA